MMDESCKDRIADNWRKIQLEVRRAAENCDRDPESITIVGVSKYVDTATTQLLVDAGCHQLAESRPQLLWAKAAALGAGAERDEVARIRWHLIGHLQRNKIRRTLPINALIQSVDSHRLLTALADEAQRQQCCADVLLEVNISGDEAKTGMSVDDLRSSIQELPLDGIAVRGLMGMAGWGTESTAARRQFEQLRAIRDQIQDQYSCRLSELSMGMSGDFVEAIAAGATMVRIGSRLFDGVR